MSAWRKKPTMKGMKSRASYGSTGLNHVVMPLVMLPLKVTGSNKVMFGFVVAAALIFFAWIIYPHAGIAISSGIAILGVVAFFMSIGDTADEVRLRDRLRTDPRWRENRAMGCNAFFVILIGVVVWFVFVYRSYQGPGFTGFVDKVIAYLQGLLQGL